MGKLSRKSPHDVEVGVGLAIRVQVDVEVCARGGSFSGSFDLRAERASRKETTLPIRARVPYQSIAHCWTPTQRSVVLGVRLHITNPSRPYQSFSGEDATVSAAVRITNPTRDYQSVNPH